MATVVFAANNDHYRARKYVASSLVFRPSANKHQGEFSAHAYNASVDGLVLHSRHPSVWR